MRSARFGLAMLLASALPCAGAVVAAPLPSLAGDVRVTVVVEVRGAPGTSGFRRCMRAKYGPRYFARVPRAHRWHMSQACMA